MESDIGYLKFNRELLETEVDISLQSIRVIRVLERIIDWRGKPEAIRVDNGPEFISTQLEMWSERNNIKLLFIRPGKPTENARVERFNGSFRRELLDCYVFSSLKEVRDHVSEWMHDYNHHRPHEALNDLTPIQFLEQYNLTQGKSA